MSNYWRELDSQDGAKTVLTATADTLCPYDDVPDFVSKYNSLPIECQNCYKGLIFWNGDCLSTDDVLKSLLNDLPFALQGKYNSEVTVLYFDSREKLSQALQHINASLVKLGLPGRTEWRISGRYWQQHYPHLFLSAKELNPEFLRNISITELSL